MPAVIVAELNYKQDDDTYYIDSYEFTTSLPQIGEGCYLFGKLEFCKIDKKVKKEISKPVELQIKERRKHFC